MSAEVVEPMIPPVLQIATSPLAHPVVSASTSEDGGDAFFDLFIAKDGGEAAWEGPDPSGLATSQDWQWPDAGQMPWPLANTAVQPEIPPSPPLITAIADASVGAQALIVPDGLLPARTLPAPDATTALLAAAFPLPRSGVLSGVMTPRDQGGASIPQAHAIAPQKFIPPAKSSPTPETAADGHGLEALELQAVEQQAVVARTDAKAAAGPEGKAPPVEADRREGSLVARHSITEQIWGSQGLFAALPDSANEDQKINVGDKVQSESHEKPTSLPNLPHVEAQTSIAATKTIPAQTASGHESPATNLPKTAKALSTSEPVLPRLALQAGAAILATSETTQIAAGTTAKNETSVLNLLTEPLPVTATLVVAEHGGKNAPAKALPLAALPSGKPQAFPSDMVARLQTVPKRVIPSPVRPADDGIAADPFIAAQSGEAESVVTPAAPLSHITVTATSTIAGQAVSLTAHQPLAPTLIAIARDTGPGTVELTLAPEELGNLRITLIPDGDTMRINLVAERPETLDLLRRHAAQLTQEFRQAGFSGTSLGFAQGGSGAFAGSHPPPNQPSVTLPEPASPPQAIPAGRRLAHAAAAGLDLRL